jgi:rhodanese-related sulfurtransferase
MLARQTTALSRRLHRHYRLVCSRGRYAARVADYTPAQVAALLRAGAIELVDVRQPEEHQAGRIAGSRLIELAHLAERAQTIDPERPVVFYCRTGVRSAMATDAFVRAGFEAYNLVGGLVDWVAAGLPLEPADGYVAG